MFGKSDCIAHISSLLGGTCLQIGSPLRLGAPGAGHCEVGPFEEGLLVSHGFPLLWRTHPVELTLNEGFHVGREGGSFLARAHFVPGLL